MTKERKERSKHDHETNDSYPQPQTITKEVNVTTNNTERDTNNTTPVTLKTPFPEDENTKGIDTNKRKTEVANAIGITTPVIF